MEQYDCIITGAGPAGLMGAIFMKGLKRVILEKNNRAGKKLLVTGKGQCNLTRTGKPSDFLPFYGNKSKGKFLKQALHFFSNEKLINFFEKRGCPLFAREDGKIFPVSLKARDVLETLLKTLHHEGGEILYNTPLLSVTPAAGSFLCETREASLKTKALLLATGGKSYPLTGSDGSGYAVAASLGHTIVPPKPALSPVYIPDFPFKECAGISFSSVEVTLWRENKKSAVQTGALLITHKGFSGPGILHISRYMEQGDIIKINFLYPLKREELNSRFVSEKGSSTVRKLLTNLRLPVRFAETLLKLTELSPESLLGDLKKETRKTLIEHLTSYNLTEYRAGDFNEAMATSGGVALDEVNPKTMESRLHKGLFFAGELLDIDGDTGGYNLQSAFSTGALAGETLRKSGVK